MSKSHPSSKGSSQISLVVVSCSVVSGLTLCDCMACGPPGSSVHEIFQARVLEWVAISFSRGSSPSRDWTQVSCIGRQVLYHWATREANPNATSWNTSMELWWFGNKTLNRMLIENSGLILLYYHLRLPNYSYVQKNTKMNPLVPSQPNLSFLFKFIYFNWKLITLQKSTKSFK